MFDIILTTLNSSYSHPAFGLRYLYANLGPLQSRALIQEFTTAQSPRNIVEALLAKQPKIIGFGVYIWNTQQTEAVVSILKKVAPQIQIILGGPEVSHESAGQSLVRWADLTIYGEADFLFREACEKILTSGGVDQSKTVLASLPEILQIKLPYQFYTDEDIRNRVIYVEASRGCPYKCEYCLSSLDKAVRSFELSGFLNEMQILIDRGVRQFKFVDRTFNLSPTTSIRILNFFLEKIDLGLFLHFEMVPDRLPQEIRDMIVKFPKGSLQFEIGIQTVNPEVAALVSRKNQWNKVEENFKFLRQSTHVHTHADLIVGLPGETLESFARGFDVLISLEPDEIQVGHLKRLKGAPIIRHDQEFGMVYDQAPPFQILKTSTMSFETLQDLARFSKYWDLYSNSGRFGNTMSEFRVFAKNREDHSLFWAFWEFSSFLRGRFAESHSISLPNLVEAIYVYLTQKMGRSVIEVRALLIQDYCKGEKTRDIPPFLKDYPPREEDAPQKQVGPLKEASATPVRQRSHQVRKAIT